jgi:hypothetical protein
MRKALQVVVPVEVKVLRVEPVPDLVAPQVLQFSG